MATNNNNIITALQIEAAGTKKDLANVAGVAYSGGEMNQWWSMVPLVIDLQGMEIAPQIPLLLSHENHPLTRLGVVTARVADGMLYIEGGIDTSTENGKAVVEQGKKFDWQLSIGADILTSERMMDEEERTINGKTFKGGHLVVKKARLREVSVVAVGADMETHMQIAASFNATVHNPKTKGAEMDKKTTANPAENPAITAGAEDSAAVIRAEAERAAKEAVEAARTAEMNRIEAIKAAAAEFPEIRERAIAAGWDEQRTKDVIEAVKKTVEGMKPKAGGNIIVRTGPEINAKTLEAALCLKVGIEEKTISASCGEQALDVADAHLRGITLKDIMVEAARIGGQNVGLGFSNDTIKAAFSSAVLPGILSNVANKKSLQAFNAQEGIAEKICSAGDLNDFKVSERYRLTDIGDLQEVPPGGEIKSGSLGEDKATNQLKTYGKLFVLTREMIYNDDLHEFLKIPTAMGMRAKRKIDQVFFDRLLQNPTQADGNALFSAAHLNYKTGTTTALGLDSLKKGIALFMDQVDGDGQPIAVDPRFLLVPTCLYPLAQELTQSAVIVGGSTASAAMNVIAKYNLIPVASPYLDNAKYTNHSDTGWYLFANPTQCDTFEIGYFQGRRTPTVEHGDTDYNTLGMYFRCYFDFGVREQDHRGMVFFKGKN